MDIESKRINLTLLFGFILFSSLPFIFALSTADITSYVIVDEQNMTLEEKATICLSESKEIMNELSADGFKTERVNDTFVQAEAIYESQVANKKKKKDDFSLIIPYCEEIKKIKEIAYSTRDDLFALKKFYNESITSSINASEIDEDIVIIEEGLIGERYEEVQELIDKAYQDIIDLKSANTAVGIFKDYTAGIFYLIFVKHWKGVVIIAGLIIIPYLLFRKSIMAAIINRKIDLLETRKKTLKNLIRQSQKEYFEHGSMSEGIFNTKTKKFAELIRDIDRQIPLLNEELIKLSRRK